MIAIIPARGGSKRLPGKNIKLLNGIPLIAYTIQAAKECKYITEVYVSTDDINIARVAEKYAAIVPGLRPPELSSDLSQTNDVLRFLLHKLDQEKSIHIDSCILLQPTSPLRNSHHISEAIELFEEKKADSVISFTKEIHPIRWHKYLSEDGRLLSIPGLEERESYIPTGAIYVLSRNTILTSEYYTNKTYAYMMDRRSSIDIDTIDDFDYVDFLISGSNK